MLPFYLQQNQKKKTTIATVVAFFAVTKPKKRA
jgi:hypothetical protein